MNKRIELPYLISSTVFLYSCFTLQSQAYNFMSHRECSIKYSNGEFYHGKCVIKGSMAQGEMAGSIIAPDGKEHTFFTYGSKNLFDNKKNLSRNPRCNKSISVEICWED